MFQGSGTPVRLTAQAAELFHDVTPFGTPRWLWGPQARFEDSGGETLHRHSRDLWRAEL
jgi:hypothetical protein